MNGKKEQAELFFRLGQLLGPLLKMADNPASYDTEERIRVHARYVSDVYPFIDTLFLYGKSEPGHDYTVQASKAESALRDIIIVDTPQNLDSYCEMIKQASQRAFDGIYSIPVPVESAIHDAHTPFSTYCLVKDLCSTTAKQIVWMDRYFDQTIFHRYFVDTPKQTLITLVTWPQSKCTSPKDKQRYADFIDVSKLFALERSATFTISKLDSTPENQRHFDEAIKRGTEMFGVNQRVHQ